MWLTVLVPVFDGAEMFRNFFPRPRLSHGLIMRLPLMVSYCTVKSYVRKQRFLVHVVGEKEKKQFVCVVCLFHPLFSLFFCTKTSTRSYGSSAPCLSLWVCHSTRERTRMSLDTVWPGTGFTGVFKCTTYRVAWNVFCVWVVWSSLQKCSFSCQLTEGISESISKVFCQIIVFCQMLCFKCRCLIVSKKIKLSLN